MTPVQNIVVEKEVNRGRRKKWHYDINNKYYLKVMNKDKNITYFNMDGASEIVYKAATVSSRSSSAHSSYPSII